MPHEITIPSLGIAMEDVLLVGWLKEEGESVNAGEAIAEVETDKTTIELTAPTAGTVGPLRYQEGSRVPVGATATVIYSEGETVSVPDAHPAPSDPGHAGSAIRDGAIGADAEQSVRMEADRGDARRPHTLSPRARRLEKSHQTDARLDHVLGGSGGSSDESIERFREIIAERVSASWRTIPHFAVVRDIDAEELLIAFRQSKVHVPTLTITDLLLRAHALSLAEFHSQRPVDLGLAVASIHGVVVPVVRDVLGLSLIDLAAARKAAVDRGRAGRLIPDDAQLPSSTLSNLGPLDVDSFTGIIAPGQTTLLTIGRLRQLPWAADGKLVLRHVLTATLNADHRALDGAAVARMLATLATVIANPGRVVEKGLLQ